MGAARSSPPASRAIPTGERTGAISSIPLARRLGRASRVFPLGALFLLAAIVLAPAAACGRAGAEASPAGGVRDDAGRQVAPRGFPPRVVSLVPSLTEVILALGAADRVVGRTPYDDDPRLARVPSVGEPVRPNLEAIAARAPDLVLVWRLPGGTSARTRLERLGAAVYEAEVGTLADLERHARRLGRLLAREAEARALLRRIEGGLEAVTARTRGRPRPSVLYVLWPDPPRVAGPRTHVDRLIRVAGGRNAFGDAPAEWPSVSLEAVLRRRPDALVLSSTAAAAIRGGTRAETGAARLREAAGWRELGAVRSGRVLVVPADLFDRPGPRAVDAARRLAAFLHPDAFDGGAGR